MTGVAAVAHGWLGLAWASGIRARSDRLADRCARRHRDRGPDRHAAPDGRRRSRVRASSTTARALVLYKAAVGAAVGGGFSLLHVGTHFVLSIAGGIAIGLAVGYVIRQVRRRTDDPPIEVAIAAG